MSLKRVPVTPEQVSGVHSDIPLYVKPSVMDGWEALSLAEAESSRWYEDEDLIVEIPREVVDSDELHFKGNSVDEDYVAFVDIDGIRADYATDATYGAQNVYSSQHKAVYHFQETSGDAIDSTSNGYTGIATDSPDQNIAGKLGNGVGIGSGEGRFNIPGIDFGGVSYVFLWWSFFPLAGSGSFKTMFKMEAGDSSTRGHPVLVRSSDNELGVFDNPDTGFNGSGYDVSSLSGWNLIAAVGKHSAGETDFYINGGTLVGTSSHKSNFVLNWMLGNNKTGQAWGTIDELRILTGTELTTDYFTTYYNNQSDVASFWGTVTDAGGDPPVVAKTGFFAFM